MKKFNKAHIERCCLEIARRMSPIDTGNMRYNAIYSFRRGKSIVIGWDQAFAYYLPLVDGNGDFASYIMPENDKEFLSMMAEGKYIKKGTREKNKGFVDRSIVAITAFLANYSIGDYSSANRELTTASSLNAPSGPFVNSLIRELHKDKQVGIVDMDKNLKRMLDRCATSIVNIDDDRYIGYFGVGYKD